MKATEINQWAADVSADKALPKLSQSIATMLAGRFRKDDYMIKNADILYALKLTLDQTEKAMASLIVRRHVRVRFIDGKAELTPIFERTER